MNALKDSMTTCTQAREVSKPLAIPIIPICSDRTDDCDEVVDKLHCWLYDMSKGPCPFLRSGQS